MEDIKELWVAEYSVQQKCFNIDTLGGAIRANYRMVCRKQNNDYLIFGLFRTLLEAHKACDEMERKYQEQKTKKAKAKNVVL